MPVQFRLRLGELPTYEETRRLWYAILKSTGFRDLECGNDPDGMLRTTFTPPDSRDEYEEHAEYYRLASIYADRRKWPSGFERLVWRLHSEGHTVREIVAMSASEMPAETTYIKRIHEVIARHRRIMLSRRPK